MGYKQKNNTAILVFAHSSQVDEKQKALPKSRKLFDALTAQTLKKVQKTELPYFHISESDQHGSSFGERFSNAIKKVFSEGYSQIITIGNDTPQLSVKHLLKTEKQLDANNFVLGPSTDGGFYLMGITKSQFETINFSKLSWQTSALFNQLYTQMTQSETSILCLERLNDIDSTYDIKLLLHLSVGISSALRNILLGLYSLPKLRFKVHSICYSSFCSITYYNKGSPIVLHN